MRKRPHQPWTANSLKAASRPGLPTLRNVAERALVGSQRMSFQSNRARMAQKLVAPLRAARLLLSWLPLKENRWPVAPLPVAFSFGSPNKAAACLGSDQAHLRATRFGRKDISYMKNSPTKARYNLGRTVLLGALAGMLLLIAAIAILGVLGP